MDGVGVFAFCSNFGFLDWFSSWFSLSVSFSYLGFVRLEELIQCDMAGGLVDWVGFDLDLDWSFSSSFCSTCKCLLKYLPPGFPSAIGTGTYTADGCAWFLVALLSDLFASTLLQSCHAMKL